MENPKSQAPAEGKRNILITSALPYVNNVPHLGNIVGSVLSGDVFERYCRLRDYVALYVCGTDEYGTTTEVRAKMENLSPREICNKYHSLHKQIYDWFDISFDQFGRTSTPQHTVFCQNVFDSLFANKLLEDRNIEQLFCDRCLKFLADSLIEGNCPGCGSTSKGDQCESCNMFLNPRDLINPICMICRASTATLRNTDHLFLDFSSLHDKLLSLSNAILFSNQQAKKCCETLLNENKHPPPKCISRDLYWGVPVPIDNDKFKHKVLYVWFNAPLGYISMTECYTSNWELWWKTKNSDNINYDVELHQFMGKDNVPFHSAFFPSYLIGTGDNWTLPHSIHATHFLLFEGLKFSKSNGIGIFGDQVKETNIPVEVWRYYLMSVRPESADSSFSWQDLQAKLNGELCDNLGNFINRVLTFVDKKPPAKGFGSVIPDVCDYVPTARDNTFVDYLKRYITEYVQAMEKAKLKDGLKAAMNISGEGNRYLQESQV
ncbi:unnamed protein product [Amaranthus hypochondriacus]